MQNALTQLTKSKASFKKSQISQLILGFFSNVQGDLTVMVQK